MKKELMNTSNEKDIVNMTRMKQIMVMYYINWAWNISWQNRETVHIMLFGELWVCICTLFPAAKANWTIMCQSIWNHKYAFLLREWKYLCKL